MFVSQSQVERTKLRIDANALEDRKNADSDGLAKLERSIMFGIANQPISGWISCPSFLDIHHQRRAKVAGGQLERVEMAENQRQPKSQPVVSSDADG